MKDDRGLYYYPSMQNKNTRMYVRENNGQVEFRLWSSEQPEAWEQHKWLPMDVIRQAAEMYKEKGSDRNPLALYDLDVATRLIRDDKPQ